MEKNEYLNQDEWTQEEFLAHKKELEAKGIKVLLVDTVANPIKGADTTLYNPYEMKELPKGSVFVFYCDTGKATKERLAEFRRKFPGYYCISLRGGRGYWRSTL